MLKDPVQEENKKIRQFGYVGFVFFGLLGLLTRWRHHDTASNIFLGLAAFFIVMTLIAPPVMKIVYRGWMAVVGVIGWLNRQILLSLVYFLFFAPTSFIIRLFRRDFMNRRMDPAAESYWEPREDKPVDPERYEQRF